MSIPVNFSGGNYAIPAQSERNWANILNTYLLALAANTLPRSGGLFTIASDLDLGNTANILVKALVSKSGSVSATGFIRLANNEGMGWRNAAGSDDLILRANASDRLEFNGEVLAKQTDTTSLENRVTTAEAEIDALQVEVQPINRGGTGATTALAAINALLPTQAGNAGRVMATDGTNPIWLAIASVLTPPGIVNAFAGAIPPTGYLLCDGSEIAEASYPDLFAVIGSTYNTQVNPTTGVLHPAPALGTFRVPDYRGIFLRGVGSNNLGVATTLGGWQDDATARNGLNNAASTVTGTTNIGHTHAASSISGTAASAGNHTHTTSGTAASAGAHTHQLLGASNNGAGGSGATPLSLSGGLVGQTAPGYVYMVQGGVGAGALVQNTGAHTHSTSGTAASAGAHTHTVSGTAAGQTLGTTNVSLASGSAAAQNITGDVETRPQNRGVNYIIKV